MTLFAFPYSPRRLWATVVLAGSLLAPALVYAQEGGPTPPTAPPLETPPPDLLEGNRLFDAKRYEDALVKLEAAFTATPRASILLRVARCQRETGRFVPAWLSYEQLLSKYGSQLGVKGRASVENELRGLRPKVGIVKVSVDPADASVRIDDWTVSGSGQTLAIPVVPGKHHLSLEKEGFEPLAIDVDVPSGEETAIDRRLDVDSKTGHVHVTDADTSPECHVFVDDEDMGPAPWDGDLEPGEHSIEIRSAHAASSPKSIIVYPKAMLDVSLTMSSTGGPSGIRSGHVSIDTRPVNAAIRLDGQPVASPLDSDVPPGLHTIEVSAQGHAPVARTLDIDAGTRISTTLGLEPLGGRARTVRAGVFVGLVSLPRPIYIEALVKINDVVGFGVQWSSLPELSLPSLDAKLQMVALQGTMQWYPWAGAFYLGVGLGMQQVKTSLAVSNISGFPVDARASAEITNFLISPRVGWHWFFDSGVSIGIGLGIQIPIANDPRTEVSATGSPQFMSMTGSSVYVPEIATTVATARDNVKTAGRIAARIPLPNLDLFKVGFFF